MEERLPPISKTISYDEMHAKGALACQAHTSVADLIKYREGLKFPSFEEIDSGKYNPDRVKIADDVFIARIKELWPSASLQDKSNAIDIFLWREYELEAAKESIVILELAEGEQDEEVKQFLKNKIEGLKTYIEESRAAIDAMIDGVKKKTESE